MHKLNLKKGGDNMANFPRIKWLNVDGQQVPFTEPQHFTGNGDETARTGHDNPLPVANYTQNESGLWLPTSKENPMPTQVTGSNVELEVYKGEDLSGTIGSSYNKPSGASKAVIEFVIEKKDDNPDGRISIVSLNRLSGSRHDSIEISSGRIYESGRFLFFWGFNNINDYELADNILGISTSPIPPINTFAHVITVRDGGVFDVTTNVSYFV